MGFPTLGPMEIGVILVILLLIFGTGKLPSVMADLGKGLRNFRSQVTPEDTIKSEAPDTDY